MDQIMDEQPNVEERKDLTQSVDEPEEAEIAPKHRMDSNHDGSGDTGDSRPLDSVQHDLADCGTGNEDGPPEPGSSQLRDGNVVKSVLREPAENQSSSLNNKGSGEMHLAEAKVGEEDGEAEVGESDEACEGREHLDEIAELEIVGEAEQDNFDEIEAHEFDEANWEEFEEDNEFIESDEEEELNTESEDEEDTPDEDEEEEELDFKVERILDKRIRQGQWQYLVQRSDRDRQTWEFQSNLKNCAELRAAFDRQWLLKKMKRKGGPGRGYTKEMLRAKDQDDTTDSDDDSAPSSTKKAR